MTVEARCPQCGATVRGQHADLFGIVVGPPSVLYQYRADPVRVSDGDTLVADVQLGVFAISIRARLRLIGINAPELHSKDAAEKARAADALNAMVAIVYGGTWTDPHLEDHTYPVPDFLLVRAPHVDNYGARLDCRVVTVPGGIDLSDEMLRLGLADPYPAT